MFPLLSETQDYVTKTPSDLTAADNNLQFGRLWRKTIFINTLTRTDRKSWKVCEEKAEKEMILMMAWAWDLPTPVCVAAQKVVRARQ